MVDVKFWGPSGWSLFHAITLQDGKETEKYELFSIFQHVLPCKYCRQSTKQFVAEMPPEKDIAYWLYKIHDRVNKKLQAQHITNPAVPLPIESPPFNQVIKQYKHQITDPKLGWDFLYSVALNYDTKIHKRSIHEKFWNALKKLYPKEIRVPTMTSSKQYFKDVYSILGDSEPLETVYARVLAHKSKCVKKTCRRTKRRKSA